MANENNDTTSQIVELITDDTSVCPIPPDSPAYSTSSLSSISHEHFSVPVNESQYQARGYLTEAYHNNNSSIASFTANSPLLPGNDSQYQGLNFLAETYQNNSSITSFVANSPLRYTSFDGPDIEDDDNCRMSDDEEGNACYKEKSSKIHATKLQIAIVLSLFFFAMELVGGIIAGSLALLSDSFHLLSDVVSFAISILSIYLAQRPASKTLSYGYHRAEILGALISIFIIWLLTGYLCLEACYRIQQPEPVDGNTMCVVAIVGVAVNIVLIFVLGHGHHHDHGDHGHGHSHDHGDNVNVRAAFLHVLGDLLSSIGVLISSIVIIVDPSKVWVDPLCTFFFSGLVMTTTFGILRSSVRVLMEATPVHIDARAVKADLEGIVGVKSVHDLHIWDLTVGRTTLTAHIRLHQYDPDLIAEPYVPSVILSNARRVLKRKYNISHVTIQIDS